MISSKTAYDHNGLAAPVFALCRHLSCPQGSRYGSISLTPVSCLTCFAAEVFWPLSAVCGRRLAFGSGAVASRWRLPKRSKACSSHLADKNPPEALPSRAHERTGGKSRSRLRKHGDTTAVVDWELVITAAAE
jgi:hypothetical protein